MSIASAHPGPSYTDYTTLTKSEGAAMMVELIGFESEEANRDVENTNRVHARFSFLMCKFQDTLIQKGIAMWG